MEGMIGEIRLFAGNFAPRGWAFCQGQLLPINQNQALFSILGTIYGGDGRTNFALPDLRGRAPIGAGQGPGLSNVQQGQRGGSETNTLNINQLPSHTHAATGSVEPRALSVEGDTASPEGAIPAKSGEGEPDYQAAEPGANEVRMAASPVTVVVQNTGGGQAINNMQPWAGMNYIIALVGVFPSRN